ncbi:MAG: hypothetical protein DRN15_07525 [Thermoprotei archaeon]|nr:MAG: hypothetical protein DRN15_07525 [Thermoprotei archaeon]RLF25031.1 MAG: hypothetical protein DRM97_02555 [Thermoprotei archaeon]
MSRTVVLIITGVVITILVLLTAMLPHYIKREEVYTSAYSYERETLKTRKLVLAFYYPWYGSKYGPTGRWFHWDHCIIDTTTDRIIGSHDRSPDP